MTATRKTSKKNEVTAAPEVQAPTLETSAAQTVSTDAPKAPSEQDPTYIARMTALRAHRLAATSDDMGRVLSGRGVFGFTPVVNAEIDRMGIDTAQVFATDRNPKVIKRFIQFVHGVIAKDFKAIDATSARILYAMKLAGTYSLTTDALAYLVSSSLKAGTVSPETRGVSSRVVSRLFAGVGRTTAPTQISRSVGDNGFMQLSGMTDAPKGKQNREYKLNPGHPLVTAFFATVEGATEGQLGEMTGEGA
jgi:hypothetical protein